ncbi:MAG: hypothetical protein WA154_13015 [Moraxellaceae bacterium]
MTETEKDLLPKRPATGDDLTSTLLCFVLCALFLGVGALASFMANVG